MTAHYRFNRLELAGGLGDLGTLLPIAMAMVMVNGLHPQGLFLSIGIVYILSGAFYGVTVPVQPMKVIGAYAIATAMGPAQILSSSLLIGVLLLLIGLTGAIEVIARHTPKSVIRGIQLSTGVLLMAGGVRFMIGTSKFQGLQLTAEPYLALQNLGPVPIGLVLGCAGGLITLYFLDSKRFPAGLLVILSGLGIGLTLGNQLRFEPGTIGFHPPEFMPLPMPTLTDFSVAFFALVIPQLPMTMGNAVLAYTDLSKEYFGEKAKKLTNRNVCLSMGLANILSFCLGGMPLCHGAGGLAAHHRFGARTAGSNMMIGGIFILLALIFGNQVMTILKLIPLSILGVLLVFAGLQLALTIMDLEKRQEYFVALLILGITLAANLAAGFIIGIIVAHLLKWEKFSV